MRGGSGDRQWSTTGIMKNQVGVDERVVLEAFSSRANPDIIIRVYSEDPLEIHYARRITSPSDVDGCMTQAAAIYDRIPGEETKSLGLLESVINILFRGVLNPPPPPFNIGEVETYSGIQKDTEQAAASNGDKRP